MFDRNRKTLRVRANSFDVIASLSTGAERDSFENADMFAGLERNGLGFLRQLGSLTPCKTAKRVQGIGAFVCRGWGCHLHRIERTDSIRVSQSWVFLEIGGWLLH